jgi:hypothetical protein
MTDFTIIADISEDGGETFEEMIFPVKATDERDAALTFVATEVYKRDWNFNHDEESKLRIGRNLAEGFLARKLQEGWTVGNFEGSSFSEVRHKPEYARVFRVGIVVEGLWQN